MTRPKITPEVAAAIADGRISRDSEELPAEFYPPNWIGRAEALESGDAKPLDWASQAERIVRRRKRSWEAF